MKELNLKNKNWILYSSYFLLGFLPGPFFDLSYMDLTWWIIVVPLDLLIIYNKDKYVNFINTKIFKFKKFIKGLKPRSREEKNKQVLKDWEDLINRTRHK